MIESCSQRPNPSPRGCRLTRVWLEASALNDLALSVWRNPDTELILKLAYHERANPVMNVRVVQAMRSLGVYITSFLYTIIRLTR